MSSIRERLLGTTNDSSTSNTSIRDRLELNSSYYKNEYKNEISKRNAIQNDIQKSTYEKGVQVEVTPFSTQRSILPIQEQSETTQNKKFGIIAGQDTLQKNKILENKYEEIKNSDEYKSKIKALEEQSNKVGYAKYEYDKQRVDEDNIGWYDKSIGRLVDGFGNLFDYNGGLVKNENGDLMYLPTFNQMKNEKVRNEYDTAIGRFAGDVLYESGKIAGSTLVNQVLPGVGSTMYFGKMFVDSTNQAISEGYDSGSATVYGLINVGLEYATGKMLGSATKGLTGGKTSSYEKLLNKTFSKVIKKPKIASILANAGSEATEEFIQEYLDNLTKLAVLEKSTDIKDYGSVFTNEDILADALYSAAIGGVTGGVIGTMSGENTNVDNNDVNLYDTFKKELEETKENTTNKDTINKIDTIISSIDNNINNDSNINDNVDTITSQINEYETLKEQNKITKEQEIELNNLKEKLNAIQNQNADTSTSSKAEVNLPTVQDIVNQEKSSQNSVNLPVYNQQSNITNSDKAILPTVNDFNSSNINMPTSNIKVDMAKIKPEILEDIKGFKLGDPSIESYKGSYIKTILNEVGIKVPNAMNYVSEVRPDMSFTTTKDLTRQQYSSISNALQKLRSIDVTSVNNTNTALAPVDIPQIKGNIPINQELLNKYANVKEIFANEKNNYDGNINVSDTINELENVDIANMTNTEIYHKAVEIFNNHHNTNKFINDNNKIIVSNTDIKESINKINNNSLQKKYLKEHLLIFSDLGDIIEKSSLVNQTFENKNRGSNKIWSYYLNGLNVNNSKFLFEFDVISKENGENHYRVQRLEKIEKKQTSPSESADFGTNSNLAISAFSDDNIPQSNENVKSSILPITNNMQNNKNNTINMPSVENKKVSKSAKEIAKTLNESMRDDKLEIKQRKWIDTVLESEVAKDKIFLADLDFDKISYVVQSNKKTLDSANSQLSTMGYEESVKYIQSKINDNNVSLTDIALAERLIQEAIKQGDTGLASDLIMDTAIIGTDLGQKVQALSLIQRLTPEGQLKFYQKLVTRAKVKGDKSFQNVEITPEMVELILNAYNSDGTFDQNDLNDRVEQFKGKIAEQLVTTKSEKLVSWRYLSMLGNPKTHIRNVVSNVAMWGTLKVKNATARTLETILPVKNRTKTWEKASKEVRDYARKTTEEMKNVITGESKYNEKTSIERKKQTFNNKTLEKIKDFNSDMLSKEDWLFSSRAFESSFREYLTAQGIKTNEDITNNTEIIEKAKLYAIEQSEIATFRQYSWLANQISKIENKNLATKLVVGSTIPFKKTPINVAKTGVKYSPIGLLKTISYDAYQVSKGNMEASQFIDNLSQGLTGTSLTLIGYALAKAGLLKGAGDDDKEGKYDSYLGNQTYSIKIGNSTYSISWLSPVAMPLLVGATAYEKLEEQSDWDMNILVDTLAQTLDPLSEMSFLSSLDDVLSSYDSGIKKFAGMVGSMGQNYLTQFIPTLFSQIASTLDDKKRSTRASNDSSWKFGEETVRKLMYKLPILRNQLEVSTDIWGNEQEQSNNIIERAFESFIAPYSRKEDISTSLDEELKRLYNSTGETSVIPGVPKAYVKYKDVTYQMSAKEYTEYKKTYGNTANTYLTKLVENENYINATDEQKANMVKEIYSYASTLANEEYFEKKDVEYETDSLKEIKKIKELNMTNTQIAEYVAQKKIISSIKSNEDLTSSEKKKEISEYLINAKLNDKQLAYLYDKYYSSEKVLDSLLSANIPIKEFIKFNSQEFTTDYYDNGKAITNSRKNKVINYVNNLNLTIPQKAMLIKLEYSSYTGYDNQIVNYINNMKYSKFEKASILKSFGFDNYDKYLIDYVNKMSKTKEEKAEILEELGFKVRNGKVYTK